MAPGLPSLLCLPFAAAVLALSVGCALVLVAFGENSSLPAVRSPSPVSKPAMNPNNQLDGSSQQSGNQPPGHQWDLFQELLSSVKWNFVDQSSQPSPVPN